MRAFSTSNGTASLTNPLAERRLLSAIINGTLKPSDAGVRADHFQIDDHRAIFEAALALEKDGKDVDLANMIDAVGMDEQVIDIMSEPGFSVDLARSHASLVRENAVKRAATDILRTAMMDIQRPGESAGSVCLTTCDMLKGLASDASGVTTRNMQELVAEAFDSILHPERRPPTTRTGMTRLDDILGEGLKPTNFVVIGARPGVGKSALMLSIAVEAAASGKTVLYISLEMSDEENARRVLTHVSGIANSRFDQAANGLTDKEDERIANGMVAYGLERLHHYEASVCRVSDVRSLAARMIAKGGLDMVCVDYIGLLRPEQNTGNRANDIGQITRDLKAMAMELGVVVVAAAQLNRENTKGNRRPVLSDLRESGSIEQDANVVIFLHDDGVEDTFGAKQMEIIVAKNRSGKRGIVDVVFRGETMCFVEAQKR